MVKVITKKAPVVEEKKAPIPRIAWFKKDSDVCSHALGMAYHTHFEAKEFALSPALLGIATVLCVRVMGEREALVLLLPATELPFDEKAWSAVSIHTTDDLDSIFQSIGYKVMWGSGA